MVLGFVNRLNPVRGLEREGWVMEGTDPGFPTGGGANPWGERGAVGEGHQHMILPNVPKNCTKLRRYWAVWGCEPGVPLDLPL